MERKDLVIQDEETLSLLEGLRGLIPDVNEGIVLQCLIYTMRGLKKELVTKESLEEYKKNYLLR